MFKRAPRCDKFKTLYTVIIHFQHFEKVFPLIMYILSLVTCKLAGIVNTRLHEANVPIYRPSRVNTNILK